MSERESGIEPAHRQTCDWFLPSIKDFLHSDDSLLVSAILGFRALPSTLPYQLFWTWGTTCVLSRSRLSSAH